jgi:hypothetical protein
MKVRSFLQKCSYSISALALTATTMFPSLMGATVHAFPVGSNVTSRSIKMSSSAQSATGVSYEISFNLGTAHSNLEGIVVDFCAGSPIVGDATCVKPTGFNIPASPTVTLQAGITGGTWVSGATAVNTNRTLKISDATGNNLAANATVTFTVAGITNTSTLGTFYARIVTYTDNSHADYTGYAPGSEGSTVARDYGGIALSTANQLTITAKVQESLIFCVYVTGATCAGGTGTSVALGDGNGVLSNYATNYTNTAKFGVASNAQGGVVVRLKGQNLCRVASPCADANTGNVINPSTTSGAMTCTADSAVTSVEQFGLRVSVLGSGVTATAPFNCAANNHGFDTNATNGVGSTYGATLASTTGPSDEVHSTVELMAKASTTTQAGIYTTTLGLIATGTY